MQRREYGEDFRLARKIRRLVNEVQYELGEIGSIKTYGAAAPRIVLRHVIGPFSQVLSSISSISRCIDTRPSLIMHFCTHSSMGLPARDIRDATKMNLEDRDWAWTRQSRPDVINLYKININEEAILCHGSIGTLIVRLLVAML